MLDEEMKTQWVVGDAINVFFGSTESGIFTTDNSGDIAQFKGYISVVTGGGESLTDDTYLWGVYPYSKDTRCDGTNITYFLPSVQSAKESTFADNLFPQIAKSKNFYMSFYNLCGLIRFKVVSEDITKVTLKGKSQESLSGTAILEMDDVPKVKQITDGKLELEMIAPNEGYFNTEKYYYFVLYPTNFTEGLTITYYKDDSYASYDIPAYNLLRNKCASITGKDAGLTFVDYDNGKEEESEDVLVIPVSTISLSTQSLQLYAGNKASLTAKVSPTDATYDALVWNSDSPAVVQVDDAGNITAKTPGTARVYATAGGISAACTIHVYAPAVATKDYIDEYGKNHGKGVAIGKSVWAPVNCGYHETDYQYGKLYQWGRKYGQGYSGEFYFDRVKTETEFADATSPTTSAGGVSLIGGQHISNSNVYYRGVRNNSNDWLYTPNHQLWNAGTEDNPLKTEYDPCPEGWRVPSQIEIEELVTNHSAWSIGPNAQEGYWMSGLSLLQDGVVKLFLPAAGFMYAQEATETVVSIRRGISCFYWSSSPYINTGTGSYYSVYCHFSGVNEYNNCVSEDSRNMGFAVRCVQE